MSEPMSPRIGMKGTPFWAAVRPERIAGQVASRSAIAPSRTARPKAGAPPASPSVTALVSSSPTRPAPIRRSTCSPPVGTQTRWRSRAPPAMSGAVAAIATPA
jgi:hypothetical protein